MTIEYEIPVPATTYDFSVDGDGEICVTIDDYWGHTRDLYFDLAEMERVVALARKHRDGYTAFKASDYRDEDAYHSIMNDVGEQ